MTTKRYCNAVLVLFSLMAAFATVPGGSVFANIDEPEDPVQIHPGFCATARMALNFNEGCVPTEKCERSLGDVRSSESEERSADIGARQCINNCSTSSSSSYTYTVEKGIKLGYKEENLWENEMNFTFGVSRGPLKGEAGFVTSIGGLTGVEVSKCTRIEKSFTLTAPPQKKVCGQQYVVLVDFDFEQDYEYLYTRVDANLMGRGVTCNCHPNTGINCTKVLSSSGTIKATGTKKVEEGVSTTESDAVDCGD